MINGSLFFDGYADTRKANGSKGAQIFRNVDNPNVVLILFEWDDLDRAWDFFESQSLRERMKEIGVQGKPEIHFLDEIEKTSA